MMLFNRDFTSEEGKAYFKAREVITQKLSLGCVYGKEITQEEFDTYNRTLREYKEKAPIRTGKFCSECGAKAMYKKVGEGGFETHYCGVCGDSTNVF